MLAISWTRVILSIIGGSLQRSASCAAVVVRLICSSRPLGMLSALPHRRRTEHTRPISTRRAHVQVSAGTHGREPPASHIQAPASHHLPRRPRRRRRRRRPPSTAKETPAKTATYITRPTARNITPSSRSDKPPSATRRTHFRLASIPSQPLALHPSLRPCEPASTCAAPARHLDTATCRLTAAGLSSTAQFRNSPRTKLKRIPDLLHDAWH